MQLLVIIILIFINAFFAASEIAFISLNDLKIDKMSKEGNKKAKKIKEMLVNPSKFLATIQIGITLAGFLSSAFASESFASELAPVLHSIIPQLSIGVWNSISIIIITIILSYFTLIFGELVPKRLAMKNYEKIAFASIGIIKTISVITEPFVKFLTVSTNIVSKIFGVSDDEEETVTEEEIRMMVDVGQEKGTIDSDEKEMINNVFEFNDKTVSEIMIPRTEITAIECNLTINEAIEELQDKCRYSRIPVYEGNLDNIIGIVYIKDIIFSLRNKSTKIKNIVKDAFLVPETKLINELFDELRKNKKQIAIVVDEYGGISGMITIEDIIEEIVGEIYDEYDVIDEPIKNIDEKTFIINGNVPIFDIENFFDIEIDDGDYDTLSGYLVNKLGKIPTKKDIGKEFEYNDMKFIIEQVKERHISKIKVKIEDNNIL